jgi:hypothetical protein
MTDAIRIVLDPEVLTGKPVIRGTRLWVDFIIGPMAEPRPTFFTTIPLSLTTILQHAWPMRVIF